jgi:PAS domain S-box-containing protein
MKSAELSRLRFHRTFARIASASVVLLGGLALVGWVLHVEALKRIIPGSDPMKPNMATTILFCGAALLVLSRKRLTRPTRICTAAIATTVIILSALTIGEYFLDWDLGIEQWLIGNAPVDAEIPHPGRMAPITAACFVLVGVALFAASRQMQKRARLRLVGGLGGTLTAAGAVPLIGFLLEMLFGPSWNYMGVTSTGIAGAIAFLLLGVGLLALLRSNAHLRWSLDGFTTAGFASGFTLMILAAGLTYNFTVKMQQAAMQVGHAQEIRRQLNETEARLLELEHEQRSYIITADERLLDGWAAKESEIRDHLRKLQGLEVDNSGQQKVLRQLAVLVSKRINRAKQTTEIRRERGLPAAQEMIATETGGVLLEQSRGLIQAIESNGDARLRESQTQSDLASQAVFLMLPLGVFVCFAIISLGVFFLNSGMGERKTAERELRESEERYRSLFESNPNPMWVYDIETLSFLAVNGAAVGHYGYSQEEFLAMTIKDIRPTEDIPDLMKSLAGETGDVNHSSQWRHCTKDRTMIDVEITSHDLIWLGRRARLVLINDITERKQAEKHLAQMEGRYRGLLEAAPDAMVVVNQGGEIVLLNLQAEKQFGYRRDELVGQKVKNIIPDGFAERLVADDLRSAEDALAQQIGTGIELTGRRKNGSDFPIEIMLSPLESADGILVTAAIRDITERKQAEDRLRQQARLLNLAHDAIMVRDMEDRVEFWNHGAEDLYGWTAAEVQGRKASTFLYQDEPASSAAARADVIEKGKWTGECKHNCKDGGTTTVRSRWTLVRDELAAPKSILIINTDVTEQRKLETHLLRAQRLESIGTLASGVAHDLNNILTPILICTEVLKGNPTREDLPPLISMIEESARRGANVVKQVLTFARGIEGERVVIKPSHLIQEMIDIAQKTFPKTIEILSRYPNDLWSIKGDPTQLHQVLLNLSVNARDVMLNGGSLTLAAENFNVDENYASMMPGAKPGPHVMLRVTDTGRGMPRAMIDKIFDPFFTTKEVGKGTGLGLSTTLGIVKSHGGFVSVYSEPGKGTTFKVFLPAATIQDDLQQSKTSVVPIQRNGHGQLILVVDDEPNILGVTKMILEKHRYDVVSASDGPEALAIFAQQMKSISLVLTDLSMPYMDGIALVRSLKKMRPELSIVASTGQGEQASVGELQSLGVKNFLSKPYNTERLLATLDDALHGRESESPRVQSA